MTLVIAVLWTLATGCLAAPTDDAVVAPQSGLVPIFAFTFQGRIAEARLDCAYGVLMSHETEWLDGSELFQVRSAPQGIMWGTQDGQFACQYVDACFHQSLAQLEYARTTTPSMSRMTHIAGSTDELAWSGVGINVTDIYAPSDWTDPAFWGRVRYCRLLYTFSIDPMEAFKDFIGRDRPFDFRHGVRDSSGMHSVQARYVDRSAGMAMYLAATFSAESNHHPLPSWWRFVVADLNTGECRFGHFGLRR